MKSPHHSFPPIFSAASNSNLTDDDPFQLSHIFSFEPKAAIEREKAVHREITCSPCGDAPIFTLTRSSADFRDSNCCCEVKPHNNNWLRADILKGIMRVKNAESHDIQEENSV